MRMLKQSAALVVLYVAGVVGLGVWSLAHLLGGTVTTQNAAAVIVVPLAWTFGFWPFVGPLLVARRVLRLQKLLEEYGARRASGGPTDEPAAELEDTLTLLAAQENHVPERLARFIVRRVLRRALPEADARADAPS